MITITGEEGVNMSQYLLLPAGGAVLSNPFKASPVHGTLLLDLLNLLQ